MQGVRTLEQFTLNKSNLPAALPRGFLVELSILTVQGNYGQKVSPDFVAVGAWVARQQLPVGRSLSRSAKSGESAQETWRLWKAAKHSKSELRMAAVLCREWVPYSKEAVVKKQKAVAPSHFGTHASKRTLHKLSVQLTRAQAETEAKVKVLERTVKQLGDSNAKCKATEFLIEKLRATIAKLQVKLLGSPKHSLLLTLCSHPYSLLSALCSL